MKKITHMFTATLALGLLTAACAKKREAALPSKEAPQIFAISEFGTLDPDQNAYSVKTHREMRKANKDGEEAMARAERGVVAVESNGARVPERLAFMFRGLEIDGRANEDLRVVFAVDRNNVTAYKVVRQADQLSTLERERVTSAEEVRAEINLQKSLNADEQMQAKAFREKSHQVLEQALAAGQGKFLVKIFSFKVEEAGQLRRKKNDAGEETSTLELVKTDFAVATHVKIANDPSKRLLIKSDDDVYLINRVNNKLTTAGALTARFGIETGLRDDAKVLILLGREHLNVFEILVGEGADKVAGAEKCTAELTGVLGVKDQTCVTVNRLRYPVSYVRGKNFEPGFETDRAERDQLEAVQPGEKIRLVRIPRNKPAVADADASVQ